MSQRAYSHAEAHLSRVFAGYTCLKEHILMLGIIWAESLLGTHVSRSIFSCWGSFELSLCWVQMSQGAYSRARAHLSWVFGWVHMSQGAYSHAEAHLSWVFAGYTCLKEHILILSIICPESLAGYTCPKEHNLMLIEAHLSWVFGWVHMSQGAYSHARAHLSWVFGWVHMSQGAYSHARAHLSWVFAGHTCLKERILLLRLIWAESLLGTHVPRSIFSC